MLKFDAKTTRQLEIAYQGADITRRRRASFDALNPAPGEKIIDIGCGNGLLTAELARAVGATGAVTGIDPSDDMRAAAAGRCADYDWVELQDGEVKNLPFADEAFDKAVSVQVFEYLNDIPGAVSEVRRVLRPGGRLVIGDIDFDSFCWFSDHPERMKKMIGAWDDHLVERSVPAILPAILKDEGFAIDEIVPVTLCDHVLKPDGLAIMMIELMSNYAISNEQVPQREAKAWKEEQFELAAAGRFFFSITQFVINARKLS